jgi:hypothetical protein
MVGVGVPATGVWTKRNAVLTVCAGVTLVGALEVFLFGVLWTHAVYGSRMAWLAGVVMPLLVITAVLGFAGARLGIRAGLGTPVVADGATGHGYRHLRRDPRQAPRTIGIVSLVLLGIPLAIAALLLAVDVPFIVSHWIR